MDNAKNKTIFNYAQRLLTDHEISSNGATGSRLLTGNHELFELLETTLCTYHNTEAALVYNSGYDANLGVLSAVPQRNDIIIYDELCHASIRDGLKMSNAKNYKFRHNDLSHLEAQILKHQEGCEGEIYVVTESVFSMDGDSPDLNELVRICDTFKVYLIIDEAHAIGVFGTNGSGLVQSLNLESKVFARIVTFGKAIGTHGAVVLGTHLLKQFLINFSRPLIYTTGLSPHSIASILSAYKYLIQIGQTKYSELIFLRDNIAYFKKKIEALNLEPKFIPSKSAIQSCLIKGNDDVKNVAKKLQENNFDVRPILSPTVPKGEERLRFCLHTFNTEKEISEVLECDPIPRFYLLFILAN